MRFLARGQRWSEVQDSSSDSADEAAAPTAPPPARRVSRFPLRTVLHAYLRGVLFLEGHSSSLLTLQRLLLDELPAGTLPRGLLRDLVYSFSFDVDTVLLHVNNFLHAAASRAVVGTATGAQEPRSSVSRSRQVGAAGAVVTGTSSPSRRPGLLPHVAFLLGCGPHVLSGTAVLLLPRNRGTAGSEVQPGGCACVLHLCCQAIVLAGTLSTAWTSCGSRFAFSKASALSLGQLRQRYGCCCLCLFCGADNTGKWLEALRLGSIALRHACYLSLQDVSL